MDVVGCAAVFRGFLAGKRRKAALPLEANNSSADQTNGSAATKKEGKFANLAVNKTERRRELGELGEELQLLDIPKSHSMAEWIRDGGLECPWIECPAAKPKPKSISSSNSAQMPLIMPNIRQNMASKNGNGCHKKAKIVRFGDQNDIIFDRDGEEMMDDQRELKAAECANANDDANDLAQYSMEVKTIEEAQIELERAQKSVQFLQFQNQEKDDKLAELREEFGKMDDQMQQKENELEKANTRIGELEELEKEKQQKIDELERKLSQAFAEAIENGGHEGNEGGEREMEEMRAEIEKLEQKLLNANEEKEYYKKHFKGEHQNGGGEHQMQNGRGGGYSADDFGKELMMANKRKYQLESRCKQMELEMKEAQQRTAHLAESLKSMEKLLWLEKERSATLEMEKEKLNGEMDELRRNGDVLKKQLEGWLGEGGSGGNIVGPSEGEMEEMSRRIRVECEQRVNEMREMKNKVEWRMGEITQLFHDAKWRLGEVEATLAHRDWELEQANNRVKQLEGALSQNGAAKQSDELNRLKAELGEISREKAKVEWRLGEVTQWWNDAKWRVGELEAETAHRSNLLDKAHHKIGELQRRMEGNLSSSNDFDHQRATESEMERKVAELDKAYNDSQWRVGELKADLHRAGGENERLTRALDEMKAEKAKVKWRLGEVTQWWNDAKWRIGDLEDAARNRDKAVEEIGREAKRQNKFSDAFLIRKQPHVDRHKWKLLTLENSLESPQKQIWFETDSAGDGQELFLIGSFLNWECALRCEPIPDRPNRKGIWVDLPPGRHEFCFYGGGKWKAADGFEKCWNENGTKNNWILVE